MICHVCMVAGKFASPDFAELSLHEKVKNRMNNEGSIAQLGVESLVALFSHIHWCPQLCGVLAIKI